jgi:hypothetical protein
VTKKHSGSRILDSLSELSENLRFAREQLLAVVSDQNDLKSVRKYSILKDSSLGFKSSILKTNSNFILPKNLGPTEEILEVDTEPMPGKGKKVYF